MNTHKFHDSYSLGAHKMVAAKLLADHSLLDEAKSNLERIKNELGRDSIAVREWEIVLKFSINNICDFIVQDNDHLQELRQSSPFSGFLNEDERLKLRQNLLANYRPVNTGV
jgi:hypothetical protein